WWRRTGVPSAQCVARTWVAPSGATKTVAAGSYATVSVALSPWRHMPAVRSRTSPLPGRPVRGSATGRPGMALLARLGRRWTLRLLWELRAGQAETFRSLQSRMDGVSPSILNTRLRELRDAPLGVPPR